MKDRRVWIELVILVACIVVLVAVPELIRFRLPLVSAALVVALIVGVYRCLFKQPSCAMREQTARFARGELGHEHFEHASFHLGRCQRCSSDFGEISKEKMHFEGSAS